MGKKFFVEERRNFLLGFMDQYKSHQRAGTVEDFWHIIIPAYIAKFPEDNEVIAPATCQTPKTKGGRRSKMRTPDQPKPLREVCL
jgi:hypothetical protein